MHSVTSCPDRRQLQRLLAGLLSEEEAAALETHVETCAACLTTLRQLPPADSLAAALHGCAAAPGLDTELDKAAEQIRGRVAQSPPSTVTPPAAPAETWQADAPPLPSASSVPPEAAGLDLRHYELFEPLGKGGMGEVYRSRDPGLGRDLALKVLAAKYRGHAEMERRFLAEARITGALQRPAIVPVYNLGRLPDGRLYFTMKVVRGRTFAEMLREPGAPTAEKRAAHLGVFGQVCQAVAYAHSKGVIHRDLKPLNVMVGRFGEVQVMDWGLAKVLAPRGESRQESSAAASEAVGLLPEGQGPQTVGAMGTPEYMPPEQANGEWGRADERLDVFALGGILCTLLTGQPPYRGGGAQEVWRKAQRGDLADAHARLDACGADAALVQLAKDCLSPEVGGRPRDAGVVADRVAAYQASVQERLRAAERERAAAQARAIEERKRRRLAVRLGGAVLALLAALSAGGLYLQRQRAAAQAKTARAEREARNVLERGRRLLDEGWRVQDLARLTEAKAEASRAAAIAGTGAAGPEVRDETEGFQEEADEQLGRARKNRRLLDDLLDVAGPQEKSTPTDDASGWVRVQHSGRSTDEQYAAAFRRWGLDVDGTAEAEALKRLRAEPAVVRQEVVAALDMWTLTRYRGGKDPAAGWRRLFRLAGQLDRNERRRQLRAMLTEGLPSRPEQWAALVADWRSWPMIWANAHANVWRRLQALQRGTDPGREPALTVVLVALASWAVRDAAGAEQVLRRALAARPDDVVLLDALGRLLEDLGPGRMGEAVECHRAVRALRPGLGTALARALNRARRPGEGEAVARDLLRRQPNNPDAHFFLGNALIGQKRLAAAAAAYRKAIGLRPDFAAAHQNLGFVLNEQGRYAEAEGPCRAAIRLRPHDDGAYNNLGLALARQRKPIEAEAAFRKSIEFRPNFAAYTGLGLVLGEQRRFVEAEAACRKAIELQPDYGGSYHNLGLALARQGKLADALTALRKAVALLPDDPNTYVNLGDVLRQQRQFAEAEAACRRAVELKPDSPEAHNMLGAVLYDLQEPAEAEAGFRTAIALKPDFTMAYSNLGAVLNWQSKLVEAEAACRTAIVLQPDYADGHNNLGRVLFNQGKLAEAEAAYRTAIALQPDYSHAYNNLGIVLLDQQKPAEAEAAFHRAVELKPNDPDANIDLGRALYEQKKYADAAAAYRRAIALQSDHFHAHRNLGLVLAALHEPAEAEVAYHRAIDLNPDNPDVYNDLGNALRDLNRLAEAEASYRKAIQLKPDFDWPHNNLAIVLRGCNNLTEAEAACRKAITLRPDFPEAYYNLGATLLDRNEPAGAAAACRKAIALRPDYADAYYNLGRALGEQRKLADAIVAYRRAIELKPDHAEAYNNLGVALGAQGKRFEAEAAYRKAIALRPNYAVAHRNLAVVLRDQNKFAESEASFREAIKFRPDDADAYNTLGILLFSQNKPKDAEAVLRKAVAVQPDHAWAHHNLGVALTALGKSADAAAAFRKAIEVRPGFASAYNGLGGVLVGQGKTADAEAAYRQAVRFQPNFVEAHFNLGATLLAQGKMAGAEAAFRKAVELDPRYVSAHRALGQILMRQGRFAAARDELRRCLELLPNGHSMRQSASGLVRRAERLLALEKRLPAVVKGEAQPKDAADRVALAWLCQQSYHKHYAAAVRLYRDAFAQQPGLADDRRAGHRFNAACAAALAAATAGPDEKEQARLRGQALEWLQADLAAWAKLAQGPAPARAQVRQQLKAWHTDADLAGVRDQAALEKRPAAERDAWRKLWAGVDELLKQVSDKK